MKKLFFSSIIITLFCLLISCSSTSSYFSKDTKILEEMSLEEKIGQMFVIRPDSLDPKFSTPEKIAKEYSNGTSTVSNGFIKNFRKYPAGGFAIFAKNIKTPDQISSFNKDLHNLGDIPPFIFIDEEGGRVARIANHEKFDVPDFPNMYEIGKNGDPSIAYKAGNSIGKYLKEYGFDVDFAPIADVNTNPDNIVIGKRAFGENPEIVKKMDVAFLEGLNKAGIEGCLKHFPGHGDTSTDTHTGYAETHKTWNQLLDCEMITFKYGIDNGVKFIMTAHIAAPNVTGSKIPSTLSYTILTEKLRNELGYKGIIITDAIEMGAITKYYKSDEAAVLAILAGADIILMPYDYKKAFKGVLKAVKSGRISEERIDESVRRILEVKYSQKLVK